MAHQQIKKLAVYRDREKPAKSEIKERREEVTIQMRNLSRPFIMEWWKRTKEWIDDNPPGIGIEVSDFLSPLYELPSDSEVNIFERIYAGIYSVMKYHLKGWAHGRSILAQYTPPEHQDELTKKFIEFKNLSKERYGDDAPTYKFLDLGIHTSLRLMLGIMEVIQKVDTSMSPERFRTIINDPQLIHLILAISQLKMDDLTMLTSGIRDHNAENSKRHIYDPESFELIQDENGEHLRIKPEVLPDPVTLQQISVSITRRTGCPAIKMIKDEWNVMIKIIENFYLTRPKDQGGLAA